MSVLELPVDDMILSLMKMRVEHVQKKKQEKVAQLNLILFESDKIASILKEIRAIPPYLKTTGVCSGACSTRLTPIRHWSHMRPFLYTFMDKIPEGFPSNFVGFDVDRYLDELEQALKQDVERASASLDIGPDNAKLSFESDLHSSWRQLLENKGDNSSCLLKEMISNY